MRNTLLKISVTDKVQKQKTSETFNQKPEFQGKNRGKQKFWTENGITEIEKVIRGFNRR